MISLINTAGWILSLGMISVGAVIALGNARLMLPLPGRLSRWRTSGSPVPLFGGAAATIGCLLAPEGSLLAVAWLPLVVDPGSLLLIVMLLTRRP
jgi:hypothetical protein